MAVDGGLGRGGRVAARGWRSNGCRDAAAGFGRSAGAGVQAGGVCGREDVEQRLELPLRSPPPRALCRRCVHAQPGAAIARTHRVGASIWRAALAEDAVALPLLPRGPQSLS